jgi:hypothetical protein
LVEAAVLKTASTANLHRYAENADSAAVFGTTPRTLIRLRFPGAIGNWLAEDAREPGAAPSAQAIDPAHLNFEGWTSDEIRRQSLTH